MNSAVIVQLFKEGKSTGQIAQELSMPRSPASRRSIRDVLRQAGVYGDTKPQPTARTRSKRRPASPRPTYEKSLGVIVHNTCGHTEFELRPSLYLSDVIDYFCLHCQVIAHPLHLRKASSRSI